jgi:hypothetical protein
MLKRSFTATLARGEVWAGAVATEPYEAAWASEAIFFVRALETKGPLAKARARVQISPDGIHWADEGTRLAIPARTGQVTFARVRQFGGYLRLVTSLPRGATCRVVVALSLKE